MSATSGGGTDLLKLRILQKYDGLSAAERRVADTALRRGAELIDYTISELARESGVSQPTVVRFCNSVGFRGIKELKRAAVRFQAEAPSPEVDLAIDEVDSEDKLVSFVLQRMREVLRETRETLDVGRLKQAVDRLQYARSIKVAGLGGSAIAARHAQHYFRRLGIPCAVLAVYETQDVSVERYDDGDVVLAISQSGSNQLVLDIVADAKRKGAAIIAITSVRESKLQELADVALQTPYAGHGLIGGHHAMERISQIAVVNMLYTNLYLRSLADGERR